MVMIMSICIYMPVAMCIGVDVIDAAIAARGKQTTVTHAPDKVIRRI